MSKKFKPDTRPPPTTMQRELFSLIGENTPPMLVTPQNKYKNTPNWRSKVTPWTRAKFSNMARNDNLQLSHWVRGIVEEDEPYRFARYNTKVSIPEWTDDDYKLFEDDEWTLEETRYLFNLCQQYELRWFVIHDRYSFSNRDIGDIKERYYDVCRALLKRNPSPADLEEIEKMLYSKEKEQLRKNHLEHLMARTPAEIAEEEALILESRRLEALGEKFMRERDEIVAFLDSPTTTANIQQYSTSQGLAQLHQQLLSEKSRKAKEPTKIVKSAIVNQILQKRLSAKEEALYGISYNEDKSGPGVYLRSTRISALKQNAAQRSKAILNELGVPSRPVMPTARVCAKFETLQQSIGVLLDAKMVHDKLETEIKVLKQVSGSEVAKDEEEAGGAKDDVTAKDG